MQSRIDDCEAMVRKYSADIVLDQDSMKEYTRKYIAEYFEDIEQKQINIAKLCVVLTESILLEQGISSQVMKAEQVK